MGKPLNKHRIFGVQRGKILALASIITGKLTGVVPKRGVLIVGPSQQRTTVILSPEILVLEKAIREVKRILKVVLCTEPL